jgi:hypothetical protein
MNIPLQKELFESTIELRCSLTWQLILPQIKTFDFQIDQTMCRKTGKIINNMFFAISEYAKLEKYNSQLCVILKQDKKNITLIYDFFITSIEKKINNDNLLLVFNGPFSDFDDWIN